MVIVPISKLTPIKIWSQHNNEFPSGKSFFPDAETVGFLSGNEEFFLLARKRGNYKEKYLNTLTNNCAD